MPDAAQEQPNNEYPVNAQGRAFAPGLTDDEKTWAMFSHLSLLGHLVLPPFAIIAPIAILATKGKDSPYLTDHAHEAINFHLSMILYTIIGIVLAIITCGIGAILMALVYPLGLVGMIMASMAANRGEFFRYPMTFRFVH